LPSVSRSASDRRAEARSITAPITEEYTCGSASRAPSTRSRRTRRSVVERHAQDAETSRRSTKRLLHANDASAHLLRHARVGLAIGRSLHSARPRCSSREAR
jgi:hypothetical protein